MLKLTCHNISLFIRLIHSTNSCSYLVGFSSSRVNFGFADMSEKESLNSLEDWRRIPICTFFKEARLVFKLDSLGREILSIALPAAMALTADPIASLVDTAFIGQIGPVELAAVGVSIALFNQVSRIAIFPLVSVTTSFVAEEDTLSGKSPQVDENVSLEAGLPKDSETKEFLPQKGGTDQKSDSVAESFNIAKEEYKRRHIPSASSAIFLGGILGIIQAILLISAAKPLLSFMGVTSDSPMLYPAQRYLKLRSLGAPAVLLSLAMQGVFRGFKDTKTPLYATVVGDATNIALDPLFMFVFRWGVSGAAIAHVISHFASFDPSFLLLMRVIAVTFCVTLSASLAARLGSTSKAAFQVCLQIWLAVSLLADGLAVAGQAILAGAFANKDHDKATATATRVLQFVAITQPLNALAFVFDGINFGASDFAYSAFSMVGCGGSYQQFSIICLLILSSTGGFIGIWVALSIYMGLRAFAGFLRIGTRSGPWEFLRLQ
ncbi:hypothetical protein RIF29_27842 [Crotalaria pallida]|uniref:Protein DETOXIFICATION n=1 Tax=Crotalaria pallida TaxID=3830 RepID=A0AAN9EX80_CROPI